MFLLPVQIKQLWAYTPQGALLQNSVLPVSICGTPGPLPSMLLGPWDPMRVFLGICQQPILLDNCNHSSYLQPCISGSNPLLSPSHHREPAAPSKSKLLFFTFIMFFFPIFINFSSLEACTVSTPTYN